VVRVIVGFLALFGFLILIEVALEIGGFSESCALCGAHSHVAYLTVFGIGGRYRRRTREGAISQFIQQQTGKCEHVWGFDGGYYGPPLTRGCALGPGEERDMRLYPLEREPALNEILAKRVRRDPGFLDAFRHAVQSSDKDFLYEIAEEICDSEP
jgi:hypothetical protein